mmetsp:Transcript_18171/g.38111  ORF Transcript_18171/g.38111 Transcript_18171/m.38111 type:complete len:89 (-) Transcript_18171:29-295(-)
MISRGEWFKRVIGLKGARFRQTGMFGSNIVVGCVLGVISGKYIFEEPLKRYWAEKNALDAANRADSADGTGAGVTNSSSSSEGTGVEK